MNNEVKVTHTLADPAPFGLFGLAVITFVASTQKLGITTGVSGLIPWAIFLGCIPQFVAAIVDFKKDNVFGATVFGSFGLFWFAVAVVWLISVGVFGEEMKSTIDMRQFGVVCIGYLFLVGPLTFGAAEAHKVLFFIFVLIGNLFLPSYITKWSILAPNVIPLFMQSSMSPEFAQLISTHRGV